MFNQLRLRQIYDSLPTIECKKQCQRACSIIPMSRTELILIQSQMLTDLPVEIDPRFGKDTVVMRVGDSIQCPMLTKEGGCSIYQIRPLICRLFGLTLRMKCPHGCVPSRWLPDEEAFKLMEELRCLME